MMNPEFKARWVSKLREEGRRQGNGMLRDEYGAQCCLDVGCEIPVEDGIMNAPILEDGVGQYMYVWHDPEDEIEDRYSLKHATDFLPEPARVYLGLAQSDPDVYVSAETIEAIGEEEFTTPGTYSLSHLNDHLFLTLDQIATVIEMSDL